MTNRVHKSSRRCVVLFNRTAFKIRAVFSWEILPSSIDTSKKKKGGGLSSFTLSFQTLFKDFIKSQNLPVVFMKPNF